ncbi:glutamate--tRNA ligase [Patescibacteria group bacterium]|nr:glutamate--tRNA ligase [Patescibacteria group bacterium]
MVRVRFAPSPTGELHIGGARTALYNYLYALKQKGNFIIRIEDTDRERLVPGSLNRLLQGLKWLGLNWQEGPDIGGPYGPYIQSERLPIYKEQAQQLLNNNQAYYCFCSSQRLSELRQTQLEQKLPSRYDRTCLKLTKEIVQDNLNNKLPFTIRLKVPTGTTTLYDLIRGTVVFNNKEIDDQVLLKSDGYPTYHLANVVDDHLMAISHVIRGEEWLPSAPKHLLLYQAFAWQPPAFAHLPNVLNKQKAKLSKRKDGATVWLETYQTQGYLPAALVNFLTLLGWHPTNDQEIFNLKELSQLFSLDRVQKGGAIFDLDKLNWFNHLYLQKLSSSELDEKLQTHYQTLKQSGRPITSTLRLTEIIKDRLVKLNDVQSTNWFFSNDLSSALPIIVPNKSTPATTKKSLQLAQLSLNQTIAWTIEAIKTACQKNQEANKLSNMEFLWPARVAVTGLNKSPDFYTAAWALGKEEALKRLAWVEANMLL